jgi:signal transduction histidine kinase
MLHQKAIDKDIDFIVEFINFKDIDLGGDNSPTIYSDEHRIMQVLLGLQSNAIKFTEKGTVQTRVQIIKEGLDRYLKISVQDTGIGIRLKD